MELNSYQRKVTGDLKDYLDCVDETADLKLAWKNYWAGRGAQAGYKDRIAGVPNVCVKVPTGGGKTFLACAAVKEIFRRLLRENYRLVVWLVPSEAILTQTVANLSNVEHPYRQRLDRDFGGRVSVCTKEMLLQGQDFSPTTVTENLTVCVLSYATLRIDSRKKDIRKVYQENGALMNFAEHFHLEDSALINILREMAPVVIVDESHNAGSELSVEMLKNLNPSFVLELTATPRDSSNIISYVDARALKAEHMIKLPVVVFKKNSRRSVIADAIAMRNQIEAQAVENEKRGGRYIRPIVLFQAQPNTDDDSATFDKIRELLIKFKIPAEQIAIKTSTINELNGVDLLSKGCKIRYIITVNALKEGWDCPFAYILASVANRNSSVEVEQIVGRILRQPYAESHGGGLLNISCVFTSSVDFYATLEKIVSGLKLAGFTGNEYRVADFVEPEPKFEQPLLDENFTLEIENTADNFDDVDAEPAGEISAENKVDDAAEAARQAEEFETNFSSSPSVRAGNGEPTFEIRAEFRESVAGLKIPQFFHKVFPNLFGEDTVLLEKESLAEGFDLSRQDANVDFNVEADDVYQIDVYADGDAIPFRRKISGRERQIFMSYVTRLPAKNKFNQLVEAIAGLINPNANISGGAIKNYVRRALGEIDEGELDALIQQYIFYAGCIQRKISGLLDNYRRENFKIGLDTGEIFCQSSYALPEIISARTTIDSVPKSLYRAEMGNMNNLELRMTDEFVSAENVRWWHRIIDRRGFRLNGYINYYPDFMVMTHSGKILLVETKGEHLANDDTAEKISLGRDWQNRAGDDFRYFMVFDSKNVDGAYSFDRFRGVIRGL